MTQGDYKQLKTEIVDRVWVNAKSMVRNVIGYMGAKECGLNKSSSISS